MGVHIVRPAPGSASREYGILRKFRDQQALEEFRHSPDYLAWVERVVDLTEGSAPTEEICGLESWFTAPGAPLKALPKWKMAVATFLGVYPTVTALSLTLAPHLAGLHFLLTGAVMNAMVVALLTWVVMPVIHRLLGPWLHASKE